MQREGLPFIRIMFMLSCLAPLFILTMIRGISDKICSDKTLIIICSSLIIVPIIFILLRIFIAKKHDDRYTLNITVVTENKDYVFTYFFTVLLPLYSISLTSPREIIAYSCAFILIILILFRLNLYYTNLFFVIFKYNVYIVKPTNSIILSKRELTPGMIINPIRISNSVFIEI